MEAELMRSTSDVSKSSSGSSCRRDEEDGELRRGPWAVEEDTLLVHCIASHGEGRWNLMAKSSGLRRSGKSCRLRWLNYLKPEVKRGNLTPEEQLLILELHSKWGNRWSKIAQHLPGRTDNEIKNYWRTRVQKQARHLNIDPNSSAFQELIRRFWMPRLLQKIQGRRPSPSPSTLLSQNLPTSSPPPINHPLLPPPPGGTFSSNQYVVENSSSEHGASPTVSSLEHPETPFQAAMDNFNLSAFLKGFCNVEDMTCDIESFRASSMAAVPWGLENSISGYHVRESNNWIDHDEIADNLWNLDEVLPSSNQEAGRMGQ